MDRERAQQVIERVEALDLEERVELEQAEWIACFFGGDVDLFSSLVGGGLDPAGASPGWRTVLQQAQAHGQAFSHFLADPRRALADKVRAQPAGKAVRLPGGESISRIPEAEEARPLYRAVVGVREIWASTPEDLLDTLDFPPPWETAEAPG